MQDFLGLVEGEDRIQGGWRGSWAVLSCSLGGGSGWSAVWALPQEPLALEEAWAWALLDPLPLPLSPPQGFAGLLVSTLTGAANG